MLLRIAPLIGTGTWANWLCGDATTEGREGGGREGGREGAEGGREGAEGGRREGKGEGRSN